MNINDLEKEIVRELKSINDMQKLNDLKTKYLGKKGKISELTLKLKDLKVEEKKNLVKK